MILETLNHFRHSPFEFRILGKGLLYGVDLAAHLKFHGETVHFHAEGEVRFGVFKSPGRFSSSYILTETNVLFSAHTIDFPKVKFKESYRAEGQGVRFQKGNEQARLIATPESPLQDPLPLIFKLLTLDLKEEGDFSGFLLAGGKQKPFRFVKNRESFSVDVSGRKLFEGLMLENKISLKIPKFKVSLELVKMTKT